VPFTDAVVDGIITNGVPEGRGHDSTLKDLVWHLVMRGLSDTQARVLWDRAVARTPLKDPAWPFGDADFARQLKGAREKLGPGITAAQAAWAQAPPREQPSGVAAQKTWLRARRQAERELDEEEARAGLAFEFATTAGLLAEEPVEWAVPGWLPRTGIGILFGEEYTGKSMLGLTLAGSLSLGVPWFGQEVTTSGTAVLCWGEGRAGLGQRVAAMIGGHLLGEKPHLLALRMPFPLTTETAVLFCEAVREAAGDVVLVEFDSKLDFLRGEENSNTDAQRFKSAMEAVSAGLGCFTLCVDHSGNNLEAQHRNRGASRFRQAMDVRIQVGHQMIRAMKVKDAPLPDSLGFEVRAVEGTTSATAFPLPVITAAARSNEGRNQRALEAVARAGSTTREGILQEVRAALGCNQTTAHEVLLGLVNDGLVIREGDGVRGNPYRFEIPDAVRIDT
jgi:hypothetical protein